MPEHETTLPISDHVRKLILVEDSISIGVKGLEPCTYIRVFEGLAQDLEGTADLFTVQSQRVTKQTMSTSYSCKMFIKAQQAHIQ